MQQTDLYRDQSLLLRKALTDCVLERDAAQEIVEELRARLADAEAAEADQGRKLEFALGMLATLEAALTACSHYLAGDGGPLKSAWECGYIGHWTDEDWTWTETLRIIEHTNEEVTNGLDDSTSEGDVALYRTCRDSLRALSEFRTQLEGKS